MKKKQANNNTSYMKFAWIQMLEGMSINFLFDLETHTYSPNSRKRYKREMWMCTILTQIFWCYLRTFCCRCPSSVSKTLFIWWVRIWTVRAIRFYFALLVKTNLLFVSCCTVSNWNCIPADFFSFFFPFVCSDSDIAVSCALNITLHLIFHSFPSNVHFIYVCLWVPN